MGLAAALEALEALEALDTLDTSALLPLRIFSTITTKNQKAKVSDIIKYNGM